MSERTAQQHIETLFKRIVAIETGDDRFRRYPPPMLDDLPMKRLQVSEVPIEAATRDAKFARKDFRLQSLEP